MAGLRRQMLVWTVLGLATVDLAAQTRTGDSASGVTSFEVASIRSHQNPDDSSDTNLLPGGRYEGKNVSVRKLIRQATGVDDRQMVGAPGWVDTERYDIDAKTGDTAQLRPELFQKLLMGLLEDRFGFRFHWETREQPVYWMVAQKGGAKLKPHENGGEPMMSVNGGARKVLIAKGISMKDLAGLMTRQAGHPVEDHTGLTGTYDVRLEWDESQSMDSGLPSLFGALEEQLGVKLSSAKGTVRVLVVDNVQRPSEN